MYVVLGTDNCKFCTKAKHLLRKEGVSFTAYSLDSPSSRWLLTLIKKSGITTVPQIWDNNGDYVGGYSELKLLLKGE
jgi:glutaredoxin|tara:strand:- start:5593 stop:5823 length:231 start_codon:yes stop_codon:yes gene_type:complete